MVGFFNWESLWIGKDLKRFEGIREALDAEKIPYTGKTACIESWSDLDIVSCTVVLRGTLLHPPLPRHSTWGAEGVHFPNGFNRRNLSRPAYLYLLGRKRFLPAEKMPPVGKNPMIGRVIGEGAQHRAVRRRAGDMERKSGIAKENRLQTAPQQNNYDSR